MRLQIPLVRHQHADNILILCNSSCIRTMHDSARRGRHKKTPAIAENFDHRRGSKWARQDSNLGPRPYQGRALTN
jgi:hypothetical protein